MFRYFAREYRRPAMISRLLRAFIFAGIVAFALGFVNHSETLATNGKNPQNLKNITAVDTR